MDQTKKCVSCKQTKPVSAYWANRSTADGLQLYCKSCQRATKNARRRERFATDPEYRAKVRQQATAYRAKHPDKVRAYNQTQRQRSRDKTPPGEVHPTDG